MHFSFLVRKIGHFFLCGFLKFFNDYLSRFCIQNRINIETARKTKYDFPAFKEELSRKNPIKPCPNRKKIYYTKLSFKGELVMLNFSFSYPDQLQQRKTE